MNYSHSADLTIQWIDKNYADLIMEQAKLTQELKDVDESDSKKRKDIVKQLQVIQAILLSLVKLRIIRKILGDAM